MNPLKTLFNKVFESTPPSDGANASKEDAAFEWNPDEETVAPTSSRATSWKRGGAADDGPSRKTGDATDAEMAASAHNLPVPTFEKNAPAVDSTLTGARPLWNDPPPRPVAAAEDAPFVLARAGVPVVPPPAPTSIDEAIVSALTAETRIKAPVRPQEPSPAPTSFPAAAPAAFVQPMVPLSDFEEVYRKAGIKSPVHGYGVERVYRLITSRRLVGLDRAVRRSALLTALDAAGVPPSDVSQDAVLRRKALTAFEAEKALELQSLRSRNESRAEALQDTVETFTRQKQSQIERLAQGSTAAVRAQSDLEIRKRMEQDRLFRSLAYFVEPLPSPTSQPRVSLSETARVIERFDATIEMRPFTREEPPAPMAEVVTPAPAPEPVAPPPAPPEVRTAEPVIEAVTVTPIQDSGEDTRPIAQSGLEMALKAAAEEARAKGWGQAALVEDTASDAVDALRKLREAKKTENES